MLNIDITEHENKFKNYVAIERKKELNDLTPIDLKYDHTMHVLNNAKEIVAQEHFSHEVSRAAVLAALYHDIARFEQYVRYHTFRDRESINHGQFGVEILKQEGYLNSEDSWTINAVLQAIGLHNQYTLPDDLDKNVEIVAKVVRDADKLDILRVMDAHLNSSKPYNPTVVLSLPDDQNLFSEVVINAALHDQVASYLDLKSVNDFCLLLATWINDMNFESSRQQFIHQGHALNILAKLPTTGHYAEARAYVWNKLQKRSN